MPAPHRLPVFDVTLLPPPDPEPAPAPAPEPVRAADPVLGSRARWWLVVALSVYVAQVVAIIVWAVGA